MLAYATKLEKARSSVATWGDRLWPHKTMPASDPPRRMRYEFVGVVEAVRTMKPGDVVIAPFSYPDGTCEFCREGLQTLWCPRQ